MQSLTNALFVDLSFIISNNLHYLFIIIGFEEKLIIKNETDF